MRNLFLQGRDWNGHAEGNWLASRGVAWWQRAWDLHSRSRVRVRTCTSCKSLEQPGFYSLTWTHKIYFSKNKVSSNPKKKKINWRVDVYASVWGKPATHMLHSVSTPSSQVVFTTSRQGLVRVTTHGGLFM
jgi:hypothetical protein